VGSERVVHNLPKVCSFNVIVSSVSCGEEHSCFVAGDGGYVYSMGSNADGKLGIGDINKKVCNVPTLVEGIYNIKKVSCGLSHTLAVDNDGRAYSWGQSFYGALGIGT
jgi:X-linked retinitis pigmentosa GTPase regulator